MKDDREIFIAKSGNTMRYQIFDRDENIAVQASWALAPTDADLDEANEFLRRKCSEKYDAQIESYEYVMHGKASEGARVRSVDSIRRFLKTGDAGVPTKKI